MTKTNTAKLIFAFLGTAALGAGSALPGCSSSDGGSGGGSATGGGTATGGVKATGGSTGTGGSSGTGGSAPAGSAVLTPTATGYVDDQTNSGVVGAWYAYGDSLDSTGTPNMGICSKTLMDPTKCSTFTAPKLPAGTDGFPPSSTGAMCTKGTVAVIVTDAKCTNPGDETGKTAPHCYATQFGAGIGLDFNNKGGDLGVKGPIDLSAYKGIHFDIDKMPKGDFRVEIATSETGDNSPFWMSGTGKSKSPVTAGANDFTWDQVLQPSWGTSPGSPMNPAKAVSIQFHAVSPGSGTALDFDFCISNLTLVK